MQLLEVQRVLGQDVKSIGQLVTSKRSLENGDTTGAGVVSEADIMNQLLNGKQRRS